MYKTNESKIALYRWTSFPSAGRLLVGKHNSPQRPLPNTLTTLTCKQPVQQMTHTDLWLGEPSQHALCTGSLRPPVQRLCHLLGRIACRHLLSVVPGRLLAGSRRRWRLPGLPWLPNTSKSTFWATR